jgi:hypothetical protein
MICTYIAVQDVRRFSRFSIGLITVRVVRSAVNYYIVATVVPAEFSATGHTSAGVAGRYSFFYVPPELNWFKRGTGITNGG